ncbi:BA14K family protein [Rhizobium sp. 1AS11]|uniref:Lectin-like protein BA14k n=1 Tax=Rhizobium leguminosarum TaxID=384 RepID=A0A4Q8Y2P6_RHILE|nr:MULTISPECIES: BA14K family protein [Rhizobium]EJC66969.1 BA14K-like protein [Rhizobium leguminosarum bv. viciae WSM1455]MCW1407344.1 BA14K family protein [Rhizobium acaciae]MCW1738831.1 BA14K family protein [Rhizobium acaciae]MCW1748112.1 BA14K family protein [Rhizobium acaciae]TAX72558.1 BA14K family protein [Rhizobium leguminosarum]
MNKFAIIALSIATAFSGMPASAGPAFVPSPVQSAQPAPQNTDARIMTVGCNNFTNCPGQFSNNRRWYRNRHNYRDRNYYRDDRYGWDRRYDRRYRRNDNTGAIIGGLAAGAIIGGIIASQPRARAYSSGSHAEYCYSRYRSYRAYDNTYQPNYGPRRQCR